MTQCFTSSVVLNSEQGGAWMAEISISNIYEGINVRRGSGANSDVVIYSNRSAWKNASAAKRWIKSQVVEKTPRKSVKMNPIKFDAKEKPTALAGVLEYKVPYVNTEFQTV